MQIYVNDKEEAVHIAYGKPLYGDFVFYSLLLSSCPTLLAT